MPSSISKLYELMGLALHLPILIAMFPKIDKLVCTPLLFQLVVSRSITHIFALCNYTKITHAVVIPNPIDMVYL